MLSPVLPRPAPPDESLGVFAQALKRCDAFDAGIHEQLDERQVLIAIRLAPLWQYQFILGPQGFINRAKQRFPIQFYHTLASFVKVTNCSVQEACAIAIGGDARTPQVTSGSVVLGWSREVLG